MTNAAEQISNSLFKIIKGFGHKVVLFTADGQKTVDSNKAKRFFLTQTSTMINFNHDSNTSEIVVNLSKGTEIESIRPMLDSIKELASRYIVEYTLKTYGKVITPKDFSFMAKSKVDESKLNEISKDKAYRYAKKSEREIENLEDKRNKASCKGVDFDKRLSPDEFRKLSNRSAGLKKATDKVNEGFSGWHGSARKSVNELGDARIVVRHKRSVDEEKRGARTRQIESIFIENADGERFKFPNRNITAAKAMLKHVNEGGTPFDTFGQYIYETMEELQQLKKFQRQDRRNPFFEESTGITQRIAERVDTLRRTLTQISGPKGYAHHFENFENAPAKTEQLSEFDNDATRQVFGEELAECIPYIATIIESMKTEERVTAEVKDFAKHVLDCNGKIVLSSVIDMNDPECPFNCSYNDIATEIAALVSYIAPMAADDNLSNMMMRVGDSAHAMTTPQQKIVLQAMNVIGQNACVAETTHEENSPIDETEISRITESFDKYNVRKIFDV